MSLFSRPASSKLRSFAITANDDNLDGRRPVFSVVRIYMDTDVTKKRRVVTGIDSNGKSAVISDIRIDGLTAVAVPEYAWHRLWSADVVPAVPTTGSEPGGPTHFPPPGGVRFIVFTVPPSSVTAPDDLDAETAMRELEQKFPGRSAHMESHQAGLHTTSTIDFVYVVDGEIWLELDDQQEVHLRTGDSVIQNGTRHAWRNHGTSPCTMVVTIVGASRN